MKTPTALAALLAMAGGSCAAATADAARLTARESVALDQAGAIAAFAVDPTIVDVSVQAGRVVLLGRRAGDTVVTVVLADGVRTFRVHVEPAPPMMPDVFSGQRPSGMVLEARYDSELKRFTGVVSGKTQVGEAEVNFHAEAVRQGDAPEGEPTTALPSASVEITTPTRSVVLLDKFVQSSPLTLDGVVLRGAHLAQGDLEVHAGIASWSPLETLLRPDGERAATVAHHFRLGGARVTPHFAWLPDSRSSAKAVAAVALEFGGKDEPMRLRVDAGFGGKPGAALDLDYRTPARQVWLRGVARPAGFAALSTARPPGTHLDGAWTERLGESTLATASGSASKVEWPGSPDTHSVAGRVELRQQLDANWSATASAGGGEFRVDGDEPLRRATVAGTIAWEGRHWGASAQYRYQTFSGMPGGGHGARIAAHANTNGWRASGFVDVQQQAPTLDLVFGDRGEVARALANAGIVAGTPEEVINALRDHSVLLTSLGLGLGPVRLNPRRAQAGVDVSWRGKGPSRPELGARLLRDEAEGVVGSRGSTVGSVYANWRVGERTDLGVAVSHWSLHREGQETLGATGVQVSLRTLIDPPQLGSAFSKPITGQVFRQDAPAAESRLPMAGVEVVLDRSRRTRTDAEGRYSFERPGAGSHMIEAVLPHTEGAYFTTPATLTREAGASADFGIALSGARLTGVVLNDAGQPLPGVTVSVEGASSVATITDSSGAYRLSVPPGAIRVSIAPETVPPGHDLRALSPRGRTVESGKPAAINFTVRALRSLEGVVAVAEGRAVTVAVPELGRSVTTDATGRFVLRRLPAGALTLVVGEGASARRHVLQVPDAPGVMRGVQLNQN
jgi:hypothetical protein